MVLTEAEIKKIISTALSYLGHKYENGFDCIGFVRSVYRHIGIDIPLILGTSSPPEEFNIMEDQLCNPPIGHIIFLKDRYDPRKERVWTHVVIVLSDNRCIHSSIFYGERVSISDLREIMEKRYDFVPSKPPNE